MGVRSGSSYRIVDADGQEHWVPIGKPPRERRQGGIFWRAVLVLVLVLSGGGVIAHALPTTQSSSASDLDSYTVRTLAPSSTSTTLPPTTKASGPAALACQALGFR